MNSDSYVADAPEESTYFHSFPNLPGELRWKIWQMAICNDETPRLHYYSLFHHDDDGQLQSLLRQMMHRYKTNPKTRMQYIRYTDSTLQYCTNVPMRSRPSQFGWTEANRFSYYWDAGLLTACKESRAARLYHQHLGRNTHTHTETTVQQPPAKHSDTVVAHHKKSENVYLKVSSKRDIICLRFSPDDMDACVSLRQWSVLLCRLPFFHLPYASDINLAFEFDDSWDEDLSVSREAVFQAMMSEASHRGLAMRAHWAWMKGEIPRWARVWLIDRGRRLPADYKVLQEGEDDYEDDGRCQFDTTYRRKFPCTPPEKHHIFSDGKLRYVESYDWDGKVRLRKWPRYTSRDFDVPVLSFIWKMKWLCTPPVCQGYLNQPGEPEHFFRVLRQLPDPDINGAG